MKAIPVAALLIAAAPAALACEAFWPDMERAALAVSANHQEQAALRFRLEDAHAVADEYYADMSAYGEYDGWEADAEAVDADVAAAEAAVAERVPFWDAADAELLTAIEAHEAACGPDRRTQELLIRHRISLRR
ncbi:hypothetical protein [Hyphomonas sp.]|uniref:hypothetical protein n=1 Tax=Hyphomonas sp. TaxID=87 RepID=UPI003919951E